LTCVQSLRSRRLTGWVAGCGLAAAEPIQVCELVGPGPWLVGPPPAAVGFPALPPFDSVGQVWVGLHLFMGQGSGHDMTSTISIYSLLARDLSDVEERCGPPLSSQRACGHCPHLRLFYCLPGAGQEFGCSQAHFP
jgi:hypothetical protein